MNTNGFTDPDEIESEEIDSSVRKIMTKVNPTSIIHKKSKLLKSETKQNLDFNLLHQITDTSYRLEINSL
jgi:hypothetical protein